MTRLTIYGDFNCPFSALASVRADVLLAAGGFEIDWRAVQHDPAIPSAGETVEREDAAELADEVATIVDLGDHEVRLHLVVPPVRSNTAASCAAFPAAGNDRDRLRRRLFAAVWAEGSNLGDPAALARVGATGRDAVTSIGVADAVRGAPPAGHANVAAPERVGVPRAGLSRASSRARREDVILADGENQ